MTGSKRSHLSSSSSGSKLKQRTACEFKRKLVEKRLMDLTNQKKKKEEGSVSKVKNRPIKSHLSSSAMNRAQAIQENLSPNFPCFVKPMQKSHVTETFRLGLPKLFCDEHLPEQDSTIVLLDENDQRYNTKYSRGSYKIHAGWKSFCDAQKLTEGDVLVFQLIEPCMFKIYIAKAKRSTEVDGTATTVPNQHHFHQDQIEAVKTEQTEEHTRDKYLDYPAPKTEKVTPVRKPAKRSSEYSSLLSFKDVKEFKDFSIYVNGLIIDSEMPTDCREKYYELCKSQNMFLHENLVQGLNGKLVAEMILETIKIADAIRAVDFNTCVDRMEGWDKTLKAFQDLGMVVGFMHVRINELIGVFREYGTEIELKRIERSKAEEEMRAKIEKIDAEIDALCSKNEGLCPVLKEMACAPW